MGGRPGNDAGNGDNDMMKDEMIFREDMDDYENEETQFKRRRGVDENDEDEDDL